MILNSIRKTISTIRNNKSKILLIFFLQVIFFLTLTLIFQNTITPAMQHAKNAVEYYDKINITEDSGMFGYLGEEPLVIYKNYKNMMYYIRFMALFAILAVIIINSLIWALTDNLINKKNIKQFFNYITNFGILTLAASIIFNILIFRTLKSSLAEMEYSLLPLIGILFLLAIFLYVLYIAYSLIDNRRLKDTLKLTLKTALKKFPKIISIYIINLLVISLFAYLIYLTIEANMILLSIAVILFILSFIFTRLFLIVSISNLTKN